MHKKIETPEFDIPFDDIDCWNRYPKQRWVYDMSRLFDAQGIQWSPFKSETLTHKIPNMQLISNRDIMYEPAYIYIGNTYTTEIITEVYITKGEIKLLRCVNNTLIQEHIGNIDLRITAFISIHFQKFSGVITISSSGNDITSIRLRPYQELNSDSTSDINRLIKRIYKKTDLATLSGLTDHVIHESFAS